MTPKPAYRTLKKLIREDWHTDCTAVTDENGRASFRGFHGDYELTVTAGDRTETQRITLSSKTENRISLKFG